MANHSIILGGVEIPAGARATVSIPVTTGLNGVPLKLNAIAAVGSQPGEVLTLLSTLHGGEWFSINSLRKLLDTLDLSTLRGTVIVVPVANPPALARQKRDIPEETDSPDLNRIFPGPLTWTSDLLVSALSREILSKASCMVDFHMGPWGSTFRDILVGSDFAPEVTARTKELAIALGVPSIRVAKIVGGFPGPRSSVGYAGGVLGIPALAVEIGGAGFGPELEGAWEQETVDAIRRLMAALGMIDGVEPYRGRRLVYQVAHRVNPGVGGLLRSRFGGDKLSVEVPAGTLLGEVISPYTGEVLEQLKAPVDGVLFYAARNYPIGPGGWAFGVASTDPATSEWIEGSLNV